MVRSLSDKVAVITGGAGGIGFAIADLFLEKGAKTVVILDINHKLGNDAVNTLNSKYEANKAEFIPCDVTTDLEIVCNRIFKSHNVVDILINSAGISNELALKKTIDVNVTALMEFSMKFLTNMRKDKGGQGGIIINLASIYGFRVDQYFPIYQASKFAVMGFTKSLGHPYNFNKTGVRVLAICPGFTKTTLVSDLSISEDAEVQKDFVNFIQKQLWQNVDSVAKCAVEIVEKADSGTAWLIEGGKPIEQV